MIEKPKDHILILTESSGGEPSLEALHNSSHSICVKVQGENQDVYLSFSSRLAMYELGRSLLNEAVYGSTGMQERSPTDDLMVEGARLSEDSSRLYVFYPKESVLPDDLQ